MAVHSVVGQLLGSMVGNNILGCTMFFDFDEPVFYIPGTGIVEGGIGTVKSLLNGKYYWVGYYASIFAGSAGGAIGGWFAGRAIGKAIRKKIGALKNINPLRLI